MQQALTRATVPFLFSIALVACGGAEPPPAAPPPPSPVARPRGPALAMTQELGSLDEGKVEQTFRTLTPRLSDCLAQGSSKVEFIGGHVKFFVRIAQDGSARWAYLSESTIGDRDTEKCMLAAVKSAKWPAPIGGEGQAQKPFDFDPSPDVRAPVPWAADRVASSLGAVHGKIAQCSPPPGGKWQATAYVQTDGTVLAAGVAPPNDKGEATADCVVSAIKGIKLASPGSWPAKVTFDLP